MGYKYFQPNKKDLKDNHLDCQIRALCKATGKDWLSVYDDLVAIGRELWRLPDEREASDEYLKARGFFRVKAVRGKKPTLKEFAETHRRGTFVVNMTGHVVTVIDGDYYDTWDSGDGATYSYWRKNELVPIPMNRAAAIAQGRPWIEEEE